MNNPGNPRGVADLRTRDRAREQKAWYWYDWANSAFFTTTLTVLFAPYMIDVAGRAAGCASSRRTISEATPAAAIAARAAGSP